MKSLSAKTFQCGVTVQGLTTLSGTVYLTALTNTATWDYVIVGTSAQGQLYTRTYAQLMSDVSSGITLSLDGLSDVVAPTPSTGQLLRYNGIQWANWTPTFYSLPAGGTTLQYIDGTGAFQTFPTSLPASSVKHQVKAGVAINKGQAVYVTSADGTNMIVGLASNASEATSSKTMGLLDATVSTNGFANVVTEGLLAGLDTSTAGAEGDPVWLGTGGNLIYGLVNKPYAPAHLVFIGIVTRKNANNGEIFVKVQNGFELKEIHDVDLITTVPVNGHILGFDGTLWVNKTIAGWLGYTPANASGTTNYISKFTGSTTLGNSQIFDNGTNVGIGTSSPAYKLDINGTAVVRSGTLNLVDYYLGISGTCADVNIFNNCGSSGNVSFSLGGNKYLNIFQVVGSSSGYTSGTHNTISSSITYAWSSGTANSNLFVLSPTINNTGTYSGIFRGFYYNPTLTSLTGTTHRGMEIASGDFIWGGGYSQYYGDSIEGFVQFQSSGNSTKIWIRPSGSQGAFNNNYWAYLENSGYTTTLKAGQYHDLSLAADTIRFKNQYLSEVARFVGSSGNLLLGTTTDSGYKLDVVGTARIKGNVDITTSGGTNVLLAYSSYVQAWQSFYVSQGGGAHNFAVSNASSGGNAYFNNVNVGIGTTSPTSILDASVSSGATSGFRFKGWSDASTPYLLSLGTQTYQDIFQIKSVNGLVTMGIVGAVGSTPDLAFQTNSTERMRITSAGNLGIGTTSPSARLHISGSTDATQRIIVDGSGNNSSLNLNYNGSNVGFINSYQNSELNIGTSVSAFVNFYTNNTERMRITAAGNVGIGTSTPSQKFVVSNGSSEVFKVYGGGEVVAGTNYIYAAYSSGTSFYAQGPASFRNGIHNDTNTYLKIDGGTSGFTYFSGNVGIGTNSPGRKLDINTDGGLGNANNYLRLSASAAGAYSFNSYIEGYYNDYGNGEVARIGLIQFEGVRPGSNNIGGNIKFSTKTLGGLNSADPTVKMTITADGNVGIGTVSPAYKLDVAGDVQIQSTYFLRFANEWGIQQTGTDLNFAEVGSADGRLYLKTGGNVGIGTTSPTNKLEVVGGRTYLQTGNEIYTLGISRSGANAYYLGVTNSNSPDLYFSNNAGTTRVTFTDGGNVGIGTSSPFGKLDVKDGEIFVTTSTNANLRSRLTYQGLYVSRASDGIYPEQIISTSSAWEYHTRNNHVFYRDGTAVLAVGQVGPSAYMTINTTGNILIGTTTDAGYKLDVNGTFRTNDRAYIGEDVTFTSSQYYYLLSASSDGLLTFTNNTVTQGQAQGFLSGELYLAGSAAFLNHRGINIITTNRNTSTGNIVRAFYASGRTGNTGAANTIAGFLGGVNIEGSGNVTNAIGLEVELLSQTNNKTITNMYGVKVQPLINSVGTITNTYGLYIDSLTAGTQTNPAYGIYQAGTDKNYFGGNVGIGTTGPTHKLHVAGSALIDNHLYLDSNEIWAKSGGDLFVKADNKVYIQPAASTTAVFDTNGNVGIGTTSPTNRLQIGSIGSSGYGGNDLAIGNGTQVMAFYQSSTVSIWYTNTSFSLMPSGSGSVGNVGIGTTSPSQLLHVAGNIRVTGAFYDSNNQAGSAGQILKSTGTGTDWVSLSEITGVDGSGTANYVTKWSDADTVTNSLIYDNGTNVGIGTTSPGYNFDVNGQVRVQDKLRVGTVNSGNGVVHMSSSATINPNTTTIVWAQNVSVGVCAFIEYYILNNNSLTDQRAGTIMVTWNQSGTPTIAHTETTTPDIGSTIAVNFTSSLVGSDARINAVNSSANPYTIVMSYKYF